MSSKSKFLHYGLDQLSGALAVESRIPNILEMIANRPSDFLADVWKKLDAENCSAGHRGQYLLIGLVSILIREGIGPFYLNCGVKGIPTHSWDIVLASEDGAITAISANVTLKERWKTENLAAWGLKREYSSSQAIVIVRNEEEVSNLNRRIQKKEAEYIDSCAQAFSSQLDTFISNLKNGQFEERNWIIDRGLRNKGLGPINSRNVGD
ncbi:MAG: hypothetical protein ACO3FP_09365 [Burkholderiales bacterium]